jgi:3'-phosphoadenosine 5'-phosphosulfate sulfotransferase (PAPS reductase)/FAD synthetase
VKVIRNESNAGYVLACNQGAGIARGEHLVFLNNDTEPQPGWIKELAAVPAGDASVGAVGARIIYPSGLLQEAGGMIFADGRSWTFGRGDNPVEEIYEVMCEVDYCSAACLLVRKDLFVEIGGFDTRYSPAYYEDTDLCFSLRKRGYKVIYNPDVCIIHHESVTAGTDESSGFRRYLAINRKKFIEKWATELSHQDTSPWEGSVPVTASRERLARVNLTQEDLIYRPDRQTTQKKRPPCLRIDKSVLYRSLQEKQKKAAEVAAETVRRYGKEYVGLAWWGGKDSAALLHIIRQAFDGRIPVKVIGFLNFQDSPEEYRFIETLSRKWGFELQILDRTTTAPPVADNGRDRNPTSPPETSFQGAVKGFGLRALLTTGGADRTQIGSRDVYFSHEKDPRYVRVRPMLHFREVDVWHYIKVHNVPLRDHRREGI